MDAVNEARRWLERHTGLSEPYRKRLAPLDDGPRLWLARAAERLGSPHRAFPVVHVAGSKGKGTTAWLCARLLEESGVRTGLSWSPHLVDERERALVSFKMPPRERLARAVLEVAAAGTGGPGRPTWAGVMALAALVLFREEGVEAAVMECGLGGRRDATGFFGAPVCVLTSVEAEHTERLGGDTAAIAAEKAGIAVEGARLFCGPLAEREMEAVRRTASAQGAKLAVVEADPLEPRAVSESLAREAARAAAAIAGRETVEADLSRFTVPGREHLVRNGDLHILLDGAHTPASLSHLAGVIRRVFPSPPRLLFGCIPPRRPEDLLGFIAPACGEVTAVTPGRDSWRGPGGSGDPVGDFLARSGPVAVAGSFHLVGEVMRRLGIVPFGSF